MRYAPEALALLTLLAAAPSASDAASATTTRYWDCAGGACGCSYVPDGLNNPSDPSHCHSNAMFEAPEDNPHGAKFYGAAAISTALGGGNWMSTGCGKCWKVTGTSAVTGVTTTLVLKGTNYCPDGNFLCAAGPHFDIAAPGFDVLQYSFAHDCPRLQPDEAEGFAACSSWMIDDQNPEVNCDCSKFNDPVLRAGCENFYSLRWDNTPVDYEELTECPEELDRLHCGYPYPDEYEMPETCATNVGFAPTPPTPPNPAPAPAPEEQCEEGWSKASWTWYQSYAPCCPESPNYDPNADTTECTQYSACSYTGSFAYIGSRSFEYVSSNNLIAFFAASNNELVIPNADFGKKHMLLKAKGKTIEALVADTCGDGDCNGCCTANSHPDTGYLVDMESNTVINNFGSLDEASGTICWKITDSPPPTGYCNWSGCNGEPQGLPWCNFDEQDCEGNCGGTWCPYEPVSTTSSTTTTTEAPTTTTTTTTSSSTHPSEECSPCTNFETQYMINNGIDCANLNTWHFTNRCKHYANWVDNNYCQEGCFFGGAGYDGDNCCPPASTTTTTQAPTTTTTTTQAPSTTITTTTTQTPTTTTTQAPSTTTTTTTTQTPITTTMTTTQSNGGGGGPHCCTWNYAECHDTAWCNESPENCAGCGTTAWVSVPEGNCLALDMDCTNGSACCAPLTCVEHSQWWHQCLLLA